MLFRSQKIGDEELLAIRSYINKIKFAGTNIHVVSRNGDVLIPRVTVFYDGSVPTNIVYDNIEKSLDSFLSNVDFDGCVYVQKVIDAIQAAENVVDVFIDNSSTDQQGIFVAQYDDDNLIIPTTFDAEGNPTGYEKKIERFFVANSGFLKQSTKNGEEASLPRWVESIILKVEDR